MSVSVIIPAWNESKTLTATMEALLGIDYDKKRCEVIVVAGGDDKTYEIALGLTTSMETFQRYIVILQGPQGKNAAIQQGIKEAKNNIIVLLDADTTVSKKWLSNMVAPIERGDTDLTIANSLPVEKNWISSFYMITRAYVMEKITTYAGVSIAFKASLVRDKTDYFFDQNEKIGVDYLLAKRFREQGHEILFARDALVLTLMPSSIKYFVLTELRWQTAFIRIDGFNCRSFCANLCIVSALISAIPFSALLFILSILVNSLYIVKRMNIFFCGLRRYRAHMMYLPGFLVLSYAQHIIGFICYVRHFLGLDGNIQLYQGQRY